MNNTLWLEDLSDTVGFICGILLIGLGSGGGLQWARRWRAGKNNQSKD